MLTLLLLCAWAPARADTPVTLFQSFAGNLDFESTGGTFRTQPDTGNSCAITGTATATLPGLPAGASIQAAYLYYGASANGLGVADPTVTLSVNGSPTAITADRTFTSRFTLAGTGDFDFFGGFEDITGLIPAATGSTSLALSGLSVYAGNPHCASQAVQGGFAVIVIYEAPGEDLRVVNVFDGFQQFRGAAITLTPSNFLIPASPINGKQLVVTWEGDVANSAALGGFTEGLTYNGQALPRPGDPFNTGGINPTNNDFNSTIGAQGITTSYGVDVDTYDLSSLLAAGQTSGSTVYSSGGDLVFLTAEVISVTNTPVSDLAIDKSHGGDFVVGAEGSWTLSVTNNGPLAETGTITVTDDLSALAGISYVSASGPGWSCGEASGVVTCDYVAGLAVGATAPPITLTVDVGAAALPSVTNTASVAGTNFDNIAANDADDDPTAVVIGDLSTSTKSGVDENGGDLLNGDTVLYTLTLTETAGVAVENAQIVDDLDASLSGFTVEAVPSGVSSVFLPTGGVNGTGRWTVSGIDVPANGSVTLRFRVTVSGAGTGEAIDNSADLTAAGISETLVAPTLIVDQSSLPATGDKPLYFNIDDSNSDGGGNDQPIAIQRELPIIPFADRDERRVELDEPDDFAWDLSPGLVDDLVIDAGTARVDLFLTEEGNDDVRSFRVDLERISGGVFATATVNDVVLSTTDSAPTLVQVSIPVGNETITPAQGLRIRLTNLSTGSSNRRIRVWMQSASVTTNEFDSRSKLLIPTSTVVNIDTLGAFDDSFGNGGGSLFGVVSPGETTFLRAEVSDPFGTFDIAGATITVVDALGAPTSLTDAPMTEVQDDGTTKIFETAFTPNSAEPFGPVGNWTFMITAEEGDSAEGVANQIFHTRNGTFELGLPNFLIMKSSPQVFSDPVNEGSNPKRIPGAVVLYQIQVTNQGRGRADEDSLTITDDLPGGLLLAVPPSGDPISYAPGATAPGLLWNYATDVVFDLSTGSAPQDLDGDGCYENVNGFQVTPGGRMNGEAPPAPSFTLSYRACVP